MLPWEALAGWSAPTRWILREAAYQLSFNRLDVLQLAAVAQTSFLDSADCEVAGRSLQRNVLDRRTFKSVLGSTNYRLPHASLVGTGVAGSIGGVPCLPQPHLGPFHPTPIFFPN